MTTLVIDRTTPMNDLLSFIGAPQLRVDINAEAGRGTIAPLIDPDDYDNETDYINAVPGLAEKILAARNSPRSEDVSYHELWNDGDV